MGDFESTALPSTLYDVLDTIGNHLIVGKRYYIDTDTQPLLLVGVKGSYEWMVRFLQFKIHILDKDDQGVDLKLCDSKWVICGNTTFRLAH